MMSNLRQREPVGVRVEREPSGDYVVVIDEIYRYYPGAEIDLTYLETCLEDAGYHFRQVLQALKDIEAAADELPEPDESDED